MSGKCTDLCCSYHKNNFLEADTVACWAQVSLEFQSTNATAEAARDAVAASASEVESALAKVGGN